jgi:hypothetical protein
MAMGEPINVGDLKYDHCGQASIWDGTQWAVLIHNKPVPPKLWVDTLPDIHKLEQMCKDYPGLGKAYENFKTIYSMVEHHYKD